MKKYQVMWRSGLGGLIHVEKRKVNEEKRKRKTQIEEEKRKYEGIEEKVKERRKSVTEYQVMWRSGGLISFRRGRSPSAATVLDTLLEGEAEGS